MSVIKRAFDLVATVILLFVLVVPMIIIALLVKATSKGPFLYWSDRVGVGNGIFQKWLLGKLGDCAQANGATYKGRQVGSMGDCCGIFLLPGQDHYHRWRRGDGHYVFVEPEALKSDWSRDRIMTALIAEGIPCGSGSCSEIYLEKAFEGNGLRPAERLPVARELGETSLMFMVHPTLSVDDMADVGRAMDKVMRVAAR